MRGSGGGHLAARLKCVAESCPERAHAGRRRQVALKVGQLLHQLRRDFAVRRAPAPIIIAITAFRVRVPQIGGFGAASVVGGVCAQRSFGVVRDALAVEEETLQLPSQMWARLLHVRGLVLTLPTAVFGPFWGALLLQGETHCLIFHRTRVVHMVSHKSSSCCLSPGMLAMQKCLTKASGAHHYMTSA
jgi:hypothetical protein